MEVMCEEFKVLKKTHFKDYMKSTGQDKVFLKNKEGKWEQVGLLGHLSKCVSGLTTFPNDLGEELAEAVSKLKGFKVRWGGSAHVPDEVESEDDDEFAGEAEE